MRDQQRGAVRGQVAQRRVDRGLGRVVDRRRRVVEHQHPRVGEHRPGQGDALPLPAGEREPALADQRVVALGQVVDELRHLRRLRRGDDLLVRRVRAAVGDVGADRVGEEEGVFEHHAQDGAQVRQAQLGQRHPTQADLPDLRVVEAREQLGDRRLARTRRPDQRDRLPRLDAQRQPVEHRRAAGVAEPHVVQLDRQRARRHGHRVRRVHDLRLGVDEVVDALDAGPCQLRAHHQRAHHPGGPDELGDVGGEGEEGAERDRAGQRHRPAQADHPDLPERGQREQRRVEPCGHPGGAHPLGVQPPRPALQGGDLAGLLTEALDHPDAGDGLLDLLRDVRRLLLGRPRRREQRPPGPDRHDRRGRQHDERDEGEQRREPQHRRDRGDDERGGAERERHHRQQPLHELQVGDRPRRHLPGAQRVLPLAVEPRDGVEDAPAQVVLDVERQAAGEVAADERGAVLDEGEHDQRGDDGDEHGGGAGHGVVDDDPGQQRPDGPQADADHGRPERGGRDPGMAQTGARQAADPPPSLLSGERGDCTPPR